MNDRIKATIDILAERSKSSVAGDSLKYTQSALNLAHVMAILAENARKG